MKGFELQIVYDEVEHIVYIGTSTSSGVKYQCNNETDLKLAIIKYIDDYITLKGGE